MPILPRRLNIRLILFISCILLATGVTSGWVTARKQSNTLLATMRGNSAVMAMHLSGDAARYLVLRDYAGLESYLLRSGELPDVARLQVCEPDGTVVGDVERVAGMKPRVMSGIAQIDPPPAQSSAIFVENGTMVIWQAIEAGSMLGWIKATYSTASIREAQAETWKNSLFLVLLWVLCSVVLLLLILRPTVKAISRLTQFARNLHDRKGARLTIGHHTAEIEELGASLNYASDKLYSAEQQLIYERERLRVTLQSIHDGVIAADAAGTVVFMNRSSEMLTGWSAAEAAERKIDEVFRMRPSRPFDSDGRRIFTVIGSGSVVELDPEAVLIAKNGMERPIAGSMAPIQDDSGNLSGMVIVFRDISEQRQSEKALHRLNRELRAISNCNQVLVRAEDEQTLLNDICRIICDEAGYCMAWVGYAENDDARTVRTAAWAGIENGYLAAANITWADQPQGRDSTGIAIRTGQTDCIQDFATDPKAAPWRSIALQRGYRSGIALPLKDGSKNTFGALTIYATEVNAFTPDERRLLEELSGDLAYGITVLRSRAERTRAERSIALLSFALNNVHEAAFLIDKNACFRYVNEESCRILGYTRDELLSLSVADVDPDFPRERWPRHWTALKAQHALTFEGRHKAKNGRIFPVEISANYLEYDGQDYNLALVRDITERKRIEAALHASEQNLALHVMQTPLAVIEWNLDFEVTKWNPAAERIFGYPTSEALGAHASLIVPPRARTHVDQVWINLIRQKGGLRSTNENMTKDGRLIYCEWYNTPLVDANGNVIAVASMVQDVTERMKAEETIREREAFIRNILESVEEGFIVVDREYRVMSANRAFCSLISMPEDRILGKPCYKVSHHSDTPCFERGEDCAVKRTFETGTSHGAIHTHMNTAGEKRYVEIKSYPITDPSGSVISAIETVNDITEKRKLEEQLRQAQKMEAIGTLAGGVAHDFNNILTAIIGYGNIIKMKMKPDDPLQASIDEILSSSDRAANLTRGLLAFSRKQIINPSPVDLNSVVLSIDKLLLRLIGEDVHLSTSLAEESLIVMADAVQIEQVLMNLATNARDAMPDGGTLSITTQRSAMDEEFIALHGFGTPGRYALIAVSDTGVGMDEETREKIFEPFFTTKELGKGTGLGLAIVYGIVKQHNGNIDVYSEPGRGTTFKIYLPLVDVLIEKPPAEAEALPPGGQETILLAEDDEHVRGLARTALEDFGYRIIEAANGQEAVDKYLERSSDIDLVILDVIMPKKSGKEVYDVIRSIKPSAAVLFTSGYAAEIIHQKGIFETGLQFISKPLNPSDLLRKIREILDGKR